MIEEESMNGTATEVTNTTDEQFENEPSTSETSQVQDKWTTFLRDESIDECVENEGKEEIEEKVEDCRDEVEFVSERETSRHEELDETWESGEGEIRVDE